MRVSLSLERLRICLPVSSKNNLFRNVFAQSALTVCALLLTIASSAQQNLTISSLGQTGTSGTNWSTSGTNPVTITTTGTASINTSVIQGYLNAGTSVIVNNPSTVGTAINSNISKTSGGNATLTFKDISNIVIADNVTISSTAGILNTILWADTDNSQGGTVDDFMYVGVGVTINTNGGSIVLAGGPDDGSNGGTSGDGIPDGFAWNGSNSITYGANNVGGLTLGPRGGTSTLISLLSNGGNIILRGATSNNNAFPGITSQGNLKIDAGTGKVTMYGKSTTGHGVELTFGAPPNIVINSASTATPAIDLKGNTTATGFIGFFASNNLAGTMLVQSSAATGGGISIEGTGATSYGILLANTLSSLTTQVLSQSGPITLRGKGAANLSLALYGDTYFGNRKDATAIQGVTPIVTASTSNILIQADDQWLFSNTSGKNTNIASTGSLTMEAYTTGYTGTLSWLNNVIFGTSFSSITLGESAENYGVAVLNSLTSAGSITAYANDFTLGNGIGLTSTGNGNINVNANGSFITNLGTRRTISTVNGNINIFADADANGSGILDIDYTTFNAGTGTTRLRTESMNWVTAFSTDKPYFNGTGPVIIEPSDAAFAADVYTNWFNFDQDANGMAGLTIGKAGNTASIYNDQATSVAGPIAYYGGLISLTANLTSTATGDIFLKGITNLNGGSTVNNAASILKTAGTGTLTMQSAARLASGTITASGTGVLNVVLWSDYGNINNGGVGLSGNITTNGGHVWAGGSNSTNGTYTWNGLTVGDGPSVGSVNNNYNAVDYLSTITTSGGDVLIWAGTGYSTGSNGVNIMSTGKSIVTGSGSITFIAKIVQGNDLTLTTTGSLNLVPDAGTYGTAITWSGTPSAGNFNVSGSYDPFIITNYASLGGLNIGYYNGHSLSGTPVPLTNSSDITMGSAFSIAGGTSLYGTNLTISQNMASTAAGNISLTGNTLSIAGAATLTSAGNLIIAPLSAATTIGLTGGTGTLAVTAANFNTNFTDGFAEIRIGNSSAGNITFANAVTLKDNLLLTTSGNLLLNDILDLSNNNLRFVGTSIVPALNKFVKTNGTGKLIMNVANNASKLFPVGTVYYTPVTITSHIGSADDFSVTANTGVYNNGTASGTLVSWQPRIDITYNIGNTGNTTGAGNVDLAFGWNVANNVTGALLNPRLVRYTGTNWQQQSGTPTYDLVAGTLNYSAYSGSLSAFGIAELNIALPVTWISFTGRKVQSTIALKWVTAAELNNAYFDVERKGDDGSFTAIGRVAAATQGNSSNEYQFTDNKPLAGQSYYRLKQVDIDGKSSYSNVIGFINADNSSYSITAAAGSKQMIVTVPQTVINTTYLLIYDGNGRQLYRQQLKAGNTAVHTTFLSASGIYIANIIQGNSVLYSKQIIN
ncbi:MAG: hypothetical protein QM726_13095 [Chitinophagaceae bacterium]